MKISGNPLLLITLIGLTAYWSLGWWVPNLVMSSSMSVFSVLIGAAIMVRYSSGFYHVLFQGQRSPREDGAHLAAIGIPSIAASIVWGGVFTLLWNFNGQPESWIGTPASNFSRLLLVGGCVALYLTPGVEKQRLSLPAVAWLTAILATAITAAFLLGAYLGDDALTRLTRPVSYPQCPPDRPYWAASHSSLYHGPESPYRAQVVPRRCFATEGEAQDAGLSPAS